MRTDTRYHSLGLGGRTQMYRDNRWLPAADLTASYTGQLKQYLAGIKAGRGYSLITGLKEEVK